jgi:hypothetical protein
MNRTDSLPLFDSVDVLGWVGVSGASGSTVWQPQKQERHKRTDRIKQMIFFITIPPLFGYFQFITIFPYLQTKNEPQKDGSFLSTV